MKTMQVEPLTSEDRRVACLHEGAHAVIFALGGYHIFSIEVAPTGATSWETTGRRGERLSGLWGICNMSDPPLAYTMRHDDFGLVYVDRDDFTEWMRAIREHGGAQAVRRYYRTIRAYISGTLAGPLTDAGPWGAAPRDRVNPEFASVDADVEFAIALAYALPGGEREYWNMVDETERILADPDIHARILAIADELERAGMVDSGFLQKHLPKYRPGWPLARPRT